MMVAGLGLPADLDALVLSVLGSAASRRRAKGKDAYGSWQADKPGTVRLIRPQDLPAPGPSSANVSRVVARPAGAMPQVPPGFKIELFAEGLSGPRIIRTAPNGDIFVAETDAGRIRVLRAADGAAKPDDERDLRERTSAARSGSRSFPTATIRNGSTSPTPTASCAFPIAPAT